MIQMPIPLGDEFKERVKNFCSSNNIEWAEVWSECWNWGVIGTRDQIEMVEDYISKLEKNN
jgi:hypothetical protein